MLHRDRGWIWTVAASLALGAALPPSSALSQVAGGYGDWVDWANWSRRSVPGDRAGLASSSGALSADPDANRYQWPPGLILNSIDTVAATIEGPGIIYRFWMPHRAAAEPFAVRMYFDGETVPRIDSDSGHILGGTYGYFADPLVSTFAGGQVCYEPIVFRESLRIETENIADRWHWYQYSYRTFPPGTELTSYSGTLDPAEQVARLAMVAMFQNAGQHPAGESATAVQTALGSSIVPGGNSLTMADLTGPGTLRRLTVRMDGAADAELDSLHLRVFYDGASQPAIDAPVSWFFGAGHGRATYRSLPVGTDSPDGFYCYWPMPFHDAVRVELHNVSSASVTVDATVVENEPGPVGPDACYLHVATNEEIVVNGQTRNVMATVNGAGHYVGNFLFVAQDHDTHFFLESDDIVFVDGELAINGTGLEDAYNGGFYYNWVPDPMDEPEGPSPPFAIRPLHGILHVDRTATPEFGRADQYRWMIGDRIPFDESLEVQIETSYCWAGSQWISVVFWYQVPAVATDGPLGDGAHRFGLELAQNAPNPAVEDTMIRFSLPEAGPARLDVFDVAGRRIETLVDGPHSAGAHEVRWSTARLPSGVYFYRLQAGARMKTRKLVVSAREEE